MAWKKEKIMTDSGPADAQFPIIVSASRSTDIPAFYSDWFFSRLAKGYSAWTNPFNGVKSYVAYRDTRFIVFWSKNPAPLILHLNELKQRGIGCYIQYTLNDYVQEGLEKAVPDLGKRIATFRELVDILGMGHVIWRFDPLILTDTITVDDLIRKIEYIGDSLKGYTEKLVFSYVDISMYRRVKSNLDKASINYQEWTPDLMDEFANKLYELNKKWGYILATCGEKIDLAKYNIKKNSCIDDELMIRLAHNDDTLMKFLGAELVERDIFGEVPDGAVELGDNLYAVKKKDNKDSGQREFCGCIMSKDIGEYNTCPHLCEYCYANSSKGAAVANYKMHRTNPESETITGK